MASAYGTIVKSGKTYKTIAGATKFLTGKGFSPATAKKAAQRWFSDFEVTPPERVLGTTVNFSARAIPEAGYRWHHAGTTFGTNAPKAKFDYKAAGEKTASLVVTDSRGAKAEGSEQFQVVAKDGPGPDPDPDPDPDPPPGNLFTSDDCSNPNAAEVWGEISNWPNGYGQGVGRATSGGMEGGPYRTAHSDYRSEVGRNERRNGVIGVDGDDGAFMLYKEGESWRTISEHRLPSGYPISSGTWQLLQQMKQTQPYNLADGEIGNTPILKIDARNDEIQLQTGDERDPAPWACPARTGSWYRITQDVYYHPSNGSVAIKVEREDGQTWEGEYHGATLRRSTDGTEGIDPGESIPSHLRQGIYHGGGSDISVHFGPTSILRL